MAKYQFTPVLKPFEQPYAALKDSTDADAKKFHDLKVYQALVPPFREVQAFYKTYEKTIAEAKLQSKANMDAIESTIKKCKGKPSPTELKLLQQSQDLIERFQKVLQSLGDELKSDMMDWRGVWDKSCADVVFDTKHLETMKGYRKELIDKQTREWNPAIERINQYALRAQTLVSTVAKASKQATPSDGAEDLQRLAAAHAECMNAGAKNVQSYVDKVTNELPKLKAEAKSGLDKGLDKAKAAAMWKVKQPLYEQYGAYAKSFSGAGKTLEMLLKSVSAGLKAADKANAPAWKKLKSDIEADLKKVESAGKACAECIKHGATIAGYYQKVINGK